MFKSGLRKVGESNFSMHVDVDRNAQSGEEAPLVRYRRMLLFVRAICMCLQPRRVSMQVCAIHRYKLGLIFVN
jgi:hypothetical protein